MTPLINWDIPNVVLLPTILIQDAYIVGTDKGVPMYAYIIYIHVCMYMYVL